LLEAIWLAVMAQAPAEVYVRIVPEIEHPAEFTAVDETENVAAFVPPLTVKAAVGFWAL
jgi:hypothetical protein